MSFIDVADRARDSILGSIDWASRFGNQLNENFVGQEEIPERLSRTRLNDANNRFNIADRLRTWEDDLAASSAESQFNNWYNNYRTANFDDITRQETQQRDLEMLQTRANIDNFDSQQKLATLQNEQQLLETEEAIDKMTYDRMYDQLKASVPNYQILSPTEKYEQIKQVGREQNVPERVMARARREYFEASEEDFSNLRKMASTGQLIGQLQQLQSQGMDVESTLSQALQDFAGYQAVIRDPEAMRIAEEFGILTPRQIGLIRQLTGGGQAQPQGSVAAPVQQRPTYGGDRQVQVNEQTAPFNVSPDSVPQQPTPEPTPVPQQEQGALDLDMASWEGLAQTLPPCATEDSVNCVWRADVQGNGTGTSFIAIGSQDNPTIIRMPAGEVSQQASQSQPTQQITTPYSDDSVVSLASQRGLISSIESRGFFPEELRGVLSNTNYTPQNIGTESQRLIQLGRLIENISQNGSNVDSGTLGVLRDLYERKTDSFINFMRTNNINPADIR